MLMSRIITIWIVTSVLDIPRCKLDPGKGGWLEEASFASDEREEVCHKPLE
jgi:hypothetical protein